MVSIIFWIALNAAIEVIKDELRGKIAEINIEAVKEGYNLLDRKYNLETQKNKKILINGNQAVGVRAMNGSSGGGFTLMVEALRLAGMIEVLLYNRRPFCGEEVYSKVREVL